MEVAAQAPGVVVTVAATPPTPHLSHPYFTCDWLDVLTCRGTFQHVVEDFEVELLVHHHTVYFVEDAAASHRRPRVPLEEGTKPSMPQPLLGVPEHLTAVIAQLQATSASYGLKMSS